MEVLLSVRIGPASGRRRRRASRRVERPERASLILRNPLARDTPNTASMISDTTAARPAYRRILVPFDASASAARALDEAVAIACAMGAAIRLLTVFDPMQHVSGFEPTAALAHDLIERARGQAADRLGFALAELRRRVPVADSRLVEGDGVDLPGLVAAEAASWDADLVVVGTHGRTGLDRFLLGSVAEAILRRSEVPVMLVRAAPAAARAG
jgi:nucleotide-binding universal stress UspA family protein